jgi:hypothetical protein
VEEEAPSLLLSDEDEEDGIERSGECRRRLLDDDDNDEERKDAEEERRGEEFFGDAGLMLEPPVGDELGGDRLFPIMGVVSISEEEEAEAEAEEDDEEAEEDGEEVSAVDTREETIGVDIAYTVSVSYCYFLLRGVFFSRTRGDWCVRQFSGREKNTKKGKQARCVRSSSNKHFPKS